MAREFKINPVTGLPECFAGSTYCEYDCFGCGFNYESALCDAEAARQSESTKSENKS